MYLSKFPLLLAFYFFVPNLSFAHYNRVKTYDLQEALEKELAEIVNIQYKGDHALRVKVKNIHKRKDFNIKFSAGLQFASRDTSVQDQILLKEYILFVKAQKSSSVSLVTYCTQANNLSPDIEDEFDLKEQANGKLLELAAYLSPLINHKDHNIGQHAVWTVTDDHDLRGLYHKDAKTALKIQKFVSDLTGKPMPEYTVLYDDGREGQVAFTGETIMIFGHHEYVLEKDAVVTCQIFNEAGEMVQEVFNSMQQRRGNVRFNFHLKSMDLPKGKYVSKVLIEGKVFKEQWVDA